MKKVLVTGATGFIGEYVIRELLKKKVQVIASSTDGSKAAAKDWYGDVTYVPLDFNKLDWDTDYFNYFGKPDFMIHLAWENLPDYKSDLHTLVNLPRHYKLLQNLLTGGLQDVTVTGTCFEYGMQEGELHEDLPVHPQNPYGIAKNQLRIKLEALNKNISFHFKWVRLFYMYGKGQNPKSLLSQLDQALLTGEKQFNMSGGEQVRDFLPVEEVAANIVTIALQNRVEGIVNCCSGHPVTVRAFVENYLQKNGKSIKLNLGYFPYPDYEPMRFWGNNIKLKMIKNND